MPEGLTPIVPGAAAAQILLLLAGFVVLWRVQFGPRSGSWRLARLPPWDISAFNLMVAGAVVAGAGSLGQILLTSGLRHLTGPLEPDLQLVVAGSAFQLGLLAGVLIAAQVTRGPRSEPPPASPSGGIRLLLAGGATFAAAMPLLLAASLPWTALLERLGHPIERQELVQMFARADSPALVIIVTLLAVLVAPVAEEVLFRAGLFRYLRTRIPRPFAIGIPAVLFAMLHGNVAAFAPLVVLGIVFALAYERTGRIVVPIIAHGLFNLNTILMLLAGMAP